MRGRVAWPKIISLLLALFSVATERPRRVSWWWDGRSSQSNATALLSFVAQNDGIVSSVMLNCGYGVQADGTLSGEVSTACAVAIRGLRKLNVGAELWLGEQDSLNAAHRLFASPTLAAATLAKTIKAHSLAGINFDLEHATSTLWVNHEATVGKARLVVERELRGHGQIRACHRSVRIGKLHERLDRVHGAEYGRRGNDCMAAVALNADLVRLVNAEEERLIVRSDCDLDGCETSGRHERSARTQPSLLPGEGGSQHRRCGGGVEPKCPRERDGGGCGLHENRRGPDGRREGATEREDKGEHLEKRETVGGAAFCERAIAHARRRATVHTLGPVAHL